MSEKVVLKISGMTCMHCKMKVEKALKTLDGIEEVSVNLEAGSAEVSFDPGKIAADDLRAVVTGAGYEVK